MWLGLKSAILFLTILPCGRADRFSARGAMPYFPIVGLLIGLLLFGVDLIARQLWSGPTTVAVVDTVFLAGLTGALHLDGLADTGDGLYGRRTLERTLAIMKDSRIGAMGMVLVMCCCAIKWAGLCGISAKLSLVLILVPAYARAGVLIGMRFLPYGRPEGGVGRAFYDTPLTPRDFWGVLLVALLSVPLGWPAVTINIGFMVLIVGILWYYQRRVGCITGDMLGALIEMTEAGLFLIMGAGGNA